MAQAAILLFFGLGALWTLLVQHAVSTQDWVFAVLAVAACMALTARVLSRAHRASLGVAYKFIIVFWSRLGETWRDAGAVMATALSADVKVRPSLVRVRLRGGDEAAHAAFANLVSAGPGASSVELDADGLLVHVLQEDRIDARELGRLEASLTGASERAEPRG